MKLSRDLRPGGGDESSICAISAQTARERRKRCLIQPLRHVSARDATARSRADGQGAHRIRVSVSKDIIVHQWRDAERLEALAVQRVRVRLHHVGLDERGERLLCLARRSREADTTTSAA